MSETLDEWNGHAFRRFDFPAYCLHCRMPREAAARSVRRCSPACVEPSKLWDAIRRSAAT